MSYDRQCSSCGGFCGRGGCKRENVKPPARKPLTGDEIMSFALQHDLDATWSKQLFEFVRSIERAHKIGE